MIADWTKLFEFLYDNGFRYVARGYDDHISALAFVNKPKIGDDNGKVYYDEKQEPMFIIDIDLPGRNTFPVEFGCCMEISDLLWQGRTDAVNHPKHYQLPSGRESVDVMREILTEEEFRGWCKGNALKYIFREGKKDDAVQDIKKARKFLEFLTEV